MGTFRLGDKVEFLNEKGGGIVTSIISEELVGITSEDGFEIPYPVSGLIKPLTEEGIASGSVNRREDASGYDTDMYPLYYVSGTKNAITEGVYLFFIPENQENPLEGRLECHLINHTPHQAMFGLFLNHSGSFKGKEYGFIEASSGLFIDHAERNQLEPWINGLVQILLFSSGRMTPLRPASVSIRLKPVRFYQETAFVFEPVIRKKAMVLQLVLTKNMEFGQGREDIDALIEKISSDTQAEMPVIQRPANLPDSFLTEHLVEDKIAEVDLHIGAISEETPDHADMLKIQTDYARKCLKEAGRLGLSKIIFIHGVGNGTLKEELLRFLREYPNIRFHDASFARYGKGATEVVFYKNK